MSLPAPWVDKIFAKLALAYGRDFLARWEGLEIADVKADWAHELGGFAVQPEAIAYALQHPPVKAPTVIEFRAICRQAPAPEAPRLEAPKADPARVAEAMQKLAPLRVGQEGPRCTANKDWAHAILARAAAGERVTPYSLMSARMALGLPVREAGSRRVGQEA